MLSAMVIIQTGLELKERTRKYYEMLKRGFFRVSYFCDLDPRTETKRQRDRRTEKYGQRDISNSIYNLE